MANPQPDRYIKLSTELWQALCKIRISGEARQMLDTIIRQTYGYQKKEDQIATSQFMQHTGLHRFAIHKARRKLLDMNLITITKKGNSQILSYSIQKDYEKWKVLLKKVTVTKKGNRCSPKRSQVLPKKVTNCSPKGDPQYIKDISSIDTSQKQPTAAEAALNKVYKDGFNIYSLINKAKQGLKQPKDWQFPEAVILRVCDQYWKDNANIKQPWPWLEKVIVSESKLWYANNAIEEGKQGKNQPTTIIDILKK